jgi:hypothetical protein
MFHQFLRELGSDWIALVSGIASFILDVHFINSPPSFFGLAKTGALAVQRYRWIVNGRHSL